MFGGQGVRAHVILVLRENIWNAHAVRLVLPAFDDTGSALGVLSQYFPPWVTASLFLLFMLFFIPYKRVSCAGWGRRFRPQCLDPFPFLLPLPLPLPPNPRPPPKGLLLSGIQVVIGFAGSAESIQ